MNEHVINVGMNKTAAIATAKTAKQELQTIGKEIAADSVAAKRSEDEAIRKSAADRIATAKKLASVDKQMEKEQREELKKTREEQKELAKQQREEATKLRDQQKQSEKDRREELRKTNEEQREALKKQRVEEKKSRDEQRKLDREARETRKKSDKEAAEAEKQKQHDAEKTKETILGSIKAVAGFALATAGLDSVKSILGTITDHFRAASKSAYDAGEMVSDYRESLLELAALKGKLGDTGTALKDEIQFRAKTLQTPEDARAFQNAAYGVGASTIDTKDKKGLISETEFQKALELGGSFQAAEHGDAATHGTLIGLIPSLIGRKTDAEEVARTEKQYYDIFAPGGASFSSMTNQFAKLAPLATTGQYDAKQMAGLMTAFSTTNREGAGENVQQFTRATIGSLGKTGKGRVEGGEAIDDYFKSLGLDEKTMNAVPAKDQPFKIADAIGADLDKQEAAAKAKGESFVPLTYLKKKGYQNQEDVGSLLQYAGLKKTGQLGMIMGIANKALPSLAESISPVEEAKKKDPALQAREAKLSSELGKIGVGAGKQEYINSLFEESFNILKAKKEVTGDYDEDVQNRNSFDPRELLFGYQKKTQMASQDYLEGEAKRLGIKVKDGRAKTSDGHGGTYTAEHYYGDDYLYDLKRQISEKGGNSLPGLSVPLKFATDSLDTAKKAEGRAPEANPVVKAVEKQTVAINKQTEVIKQGQTPKNAPAPPFGEKTKQRR